MMAEEEKQPMYELDPAEKPVEGTPVPTTLASTTLPQYVPHASTTLAGSQRDYQKACLGTTCCGIFGVGSGCGALGTILCCNSFRGRAGAATGCAVVTSIKLFLTILLLTLTFVVGCHMMKAAPPQQVEGLKYSWDITAEECKAAGGSWRDHSPLGPWCSGACPTGYVYRSNDQGRPEQREYCVEVSAMKAGKAEPVPPPPQEHHWHKFWHHGHHGHHHGDGHHGHHGMRHHHEDGEHRWHRHEGMRHHHEGGERHHHHEGMPQRPEMETDRSDSQDAGRRDGADNEDSRDAAAAKITAKSYARDACVELTADQQAPNGRVFKEGTRGHLTSHNVPGQEPYHMGMQVAWVTVGGTDFQVHVDQVKPCHVVDAEEDDDDDDEDEEMELHKGVMVLYVFGLALMLTLFMALRRHWLRRAAIAEEQQRTWVVVGLPGTTADPIQV